MPSTQAYSSRHMCVTCHKNERRIRVQRTVLPAAVGEELHCDGSLNSPLMITA